MTYQTLISEAPDLKIESARNLQIDQPRVAPRGKRSWRQYANGRS